MHQEFWKTLMEAASSTAGAELEPCTSKSTIPSGSSTPQVIKTHRQHVATYKKLMMESGIELTMGEDRTALLILCLPHNIHQSPNPFLISYILHLTPSFYFHLGLTEDLIGQLHSPNCGSPAHGYCATAKVALLGSLAAGLIDLLTERLQQSSFPNPNAQPPQVYISSLSTPPSQMIPIVGLNVPLSEKMSDEKQTGLQQWLQIFRKHPQMVQNVTALLLHLLP